MFVRPARSGATSGVRSPKTPAAEDLGQHVLERAVAAVHDEQVDLLPGELGERFGHHAGVLGLHVEHVGVARGGSRASGSPAPGSCPHADC